MIEADGAGDFIERGADDLGEDVDEPTGLIADALQALDDLEDRMDKLVEDAAYISDGIFELGLMLQEVAADPRLREPEKEEESP